MSLRETMFYLRPQILEVNLKSKDSPLSAVLGYSRTQHWDGSHKTWDRVPAVPLCNHRQDPAPSPGLERLEEMSLGPISILGFWAFTGAAICLLPTVEREVESVGEVRQGPWDCQMLRQCPGFLGAHQTTVLVSINQMPWSQ